MNCEMCGAEGKIVVAMVEGVELNVCMNCARFGQVLKKPVIKKKKRVEKKQMSGPERIQVVRDDFSKLIRKKREQLGLKQEEFARYLAERESLVQQMESGEYVPSLELARKLERKLKIDLVQQKTVEQVKTKPSDSTYTIGDVIKLK